MSKVLFFETSLDGHRYEYLKNLHDYAVMKGIEAVFVLPKDDRIKDWTSGDNVKVDFLSETELHSVSKGNLLLASYRKSRLVSECAKKYRTTHVFLIFLMLYMPFLIWMLSSGVSVSGIVYRSFLWADSAKKSRIRRGLEWLRFGIMAKSKKVEKVLMLNDDKSASVFNLRFKTNKFMRLPDPYTPLEGEIVDLKGQLGIAVSDNLFIQIGCLSDRKGTLEILDAIQMMSNEEKVHNYFYFAGKVAKEIRSEFYEKVEILRDNGARVFVKDEFLSFEFINSLCASSDCIMVPYKNTSQSSGVIGYAAQYGKPIIGPSAGLLGYLISHYNLGYQIDSVCAERIYNAIHNFERINIPCDYVDNNKLSDFLMLCLNSPVDKKDD